MLERKLCEGVLSVAIQTLMELMTYGKTYMMFVQTQDKLANMNVGMRLRDVTKVVRVEQTEKLDRIPFILFSNIRMLTAILIFIHSKEKMHSGKEN